MRTTDLRIVMAAIMAATLALAAAGHTERRTEIRAVISDLYETWNRHDATAIVKDFTADHDHINTFGGWAKSKAQIEHVYVRGHDSGGPLTRSGEKKHHFITPRQYYCVSGKVNSADKLHLVVES